MTRTELRILSPIASELRLAHPHDWWSLKYQTQFGPEFDDWPHFVAALEFVRPAEEAVHGLPRSAKSLLVAEWRSKPRDRSVTPIEAVLDGYASMIIEVLVKRAITAGERTDSW